MSSSTVNNTIFFNDVEAYIAANWTEGSAIRQLWDKYPAKQAWMPN